MHHFDYINHELCAEEIPLAEIAAQVGTPFYCYSTATLKRHFRVFSDSFKSSDVLVAYSIKANSNLSVVRTLAQEGAGADVVSGGELRRALVAGVPGQKIVFSGVGKTAEEMAQALDAQIHQINVESEPELELLQQVAVSKNMIAPITIRVNPDVDAKTHAKITTGKAENKFGIAWERAREVYRRAGDLSHIDVVGVDIHIGSQITDLTPFKTAFARAVELVKVLRGDGHDIRRLDLGGGLGIPYQASNSGVPPLPSEYGGMIEKLTAGLGVQLIFEPGRLIVGNAGCLVSKVLYVKYGTERCFLILDAAMNDLIRPALYDAYHDIVPVHEPKPDAALQSYDVVGPVCETGDTFAIQRPLPELKAGDLVALMSAGAYGAVQASEYNTRPLTPEVLVNGKNMAVVRARPSYDEILQRESFANWLE